LEDVDETHDEMCYLYDSRIIASGGFESQDAVQVTDPGHEESTSDILISNRNIAARKLYTDVVLACSLNVEVEMPGIILILVTTTQ
jgi:hypothetical protein